MNHGRTEGREGPLCGNGCQRAVDVALDALPSDAKEDYYNETCSARLYPATCCHGLLRFTHVGAIGHNAN